MPAPGDPHDNDLCTCGRPRRLHPTSDCANGFVGRAINPSEPTVCMACEQRVELTVRDVCPDCVAKLKDAAVRAGFIIDAGHLIYHCLSCLCFIRLPESSTCPCGRELHPVQFRALPNVRFWPSESTESKLTNMPPK